MKFPIMNLFGLLYMKDLR